MNRSKGDKDFLPESIKARLESETGSEVVNARPQSGGDISSSAIVSFLSGLKLFVKWNFHAPPGFFAAEAAGLTALCSSNTIRIPRVEIAEDDPAEGPAFIAMEALTVGAASPEALGRGLAALHRTTERFFGFGSDNFIGSLPQRNNREKLWSTFFIDQRISPQVEYGQRSGWFDWSFETVLKSKLAKIRDRLDADPSGPSLLHGDLWSGNVFWSTDGPALIDPAVYYGSREADLAFTELFGGFDRAFYAGYDAEYRLDIGYEKRKEILNLYHLMNHANLFGGSYIGSVGRALRDL